MTNNAGMTDSADYFDLLADFFAGAFAAGFAAGLAAGFVDDFAGDDLAFGSDFASESSVVAVSARRFSA